MLIKKLLKSQEKFSIKFWRARKLGIKFAEESAIEEKARDTLDLLYIINSTCVRVP